MWQQLSFESRYPEFAEELLLACGAVSVSLVDAADTPVLEPAPGATPLWPQTKTVALFDGDADLAPACAALRETLDDGAELVFERAVVEDQDWVRQCLETLQPLRFGRRLWICPTHRQVDAPDAVIVRLDPGLAFGTGTHPTTALCLEWLEQQALQGASVLDYGCGSGILAIAAMKLGAARATATDIDPQAMLATRSNAADNDVAEHLHALIASEFTPAPYDCVLANILAQPLIDLAPRIKACVAPQGRLALAGLLDRQADEVAAAYPEFRLARHSRDGWTRLSGVRIGM